MSRDFLPLLGSRDESQDICFISEQNYQDFLSNRATSIDEGKILNPPISDYKRIQSLDMQKGKILVIATYEPGGSFGTKAAGEELTNPTVGAIDNVTYKAVGVRINDLPITPEKMLKTLG